MQATSQFQGTLGPEESGFYRHCLRLLNQSGIDYLVGGAFALAHYTGIVRHTKDFDIFVLPQDCERVLNLFTAAGFHTELTFPHWLGKVFKADNFLDIIFSSGNGVARVDHLWFEHAVHAKLLEEPTRLCPIEETIWSKGFVIERERYDGADINHLLRTHARVLDWRRLLRRFGPHWRVLLSHLVLFGYVYPSERMHVPAWVLALLLRRLQAEIPTPGQGQLCRGTLLSRAQYLIDIDQWGYQDARLVPEEYMTAEEIENWTAAIDSTP